jgi:hypothetical protein
MAKTNHHYYSDYQSVKTKQGNFFIERLAGDQWEYLKDENGNRLKFKTEQEANEFCSDMNYMIRG